MNHTGYCQGVSEVLIYCDLLGVCDLLYDLWQKKHQLNTNFVSIFQS